MPHSIILGDACFAYFNKIWGIPPTDHTSLVVAPMGDADFKCNN
jgi:hypothetical protein